MTTNYPGSVDSFTTKTDGVDVVQASHVNNLQDSVVAVQTAAQRRDLRVVNNGSGGTVAAGDVGYIDNTGDYVETTTANLSGVAWCVVVSGGADETDIVVATSGSKVTVALNANCSIGDYLYTSTTAGQASVLSYVRPEVFAVATTANSAGAGGTCEALLLTSRIFTPMNASYDLIRVDNSDDSGWDSTQNGAPAGAVITYNVPLVSGNESSIVPVSTNELCKFILHNTTRGETAYISSVDTGANTITVTDASDVSSWANTDVLTVESPTVIGVGTGALMEVYVLSTDIPTLTVALAINHTVTGVGAEISYLHPYSTYAGGKASGTANGDGGLVVRSQLVSLIDRKYTASCVASGVNTTTWVQRLSGIWIAAP